MSDRIVTVFGGTGFLGRRIVRHLREHGFAVRISSRHPDRGRDLFGASDPGLVSVAADVHNQSSVAGALAGAYGAVNAVSLYVEHGRDTFQSVHVEGARRVAAEAKSAGAERLVHISGIGSDPQSRSSYIRRRGEGELAVRAAYPNAVFIRPAVMFAQDDTFLTTILDLLRRFPAYPMFGRGDTKLQPVYVEDVAEAAARGIAQSEAKPMIYECTGPRVYSYEELLRTIADAAGLKPFLLPFPFAGWQAIAAIAEFLPSPPITRTQVELMEVDTVASPGMPGLTDLGITARPLEEVLPAILSNR